MPVESHYIELDASRREFLPSIRLACEDILSGMSKVSMWQTMGSQDIKQRYRRSVIGPFWLTISTAIMVGALGFLYAELFRQPIIDYLPFVAVGMIVWLYFSGMMTDACLVFAQSERMIKQVRLPLTLYVCRMVWRNTIILAHNFLIIVLLMFFVHHYRFIDLLSLPFAIVLLAANGVWLGLLLGVLCTRFRDLPPIVGSIVQVAFFVTPIMWKPEILTSRAWFVEANPFYHFIEIVRAPILGASFPWTSWGVTLSITVFGFVLAIFVLSKCRHRVAYWV